MLQQYKDDKVEHQANNTIMDSKTSSTASTVKTTSTRRSRNPTEHGMSKFHDLSGEMKLDPNDDRRPEIPPERSSARVAAQRNMNGWGTGTINSGMEGLQQMAPGRKNLSRAVKPQSGRPKRPEEAPSPKPNLSKAPETRTGRPTSKRKVEEDVPPPVPSHKKSRSVTEPNANRSERRPASGMDRLIAAMIQDQPAGPAAPLKEKRTLGSLSPAADTSQAETRQVLDGVPIANQQAEPLAVATNARLRNPEADNFDRESANESSSSCIDVAHSRPTFTHHQEDSPARVSQETKVLIHKPGATSTTSDIPKTPPRSRRQTSDISSPLSDVPSCINEEIEREIRVRTSGESGAKDDVKLSEASNDDSSSLSRATDSGSAWNVSPAQVPMPAPAPISLPVEKPSLAEEQAKPTMSRPRRSVQPITRFGASSGHKPLAMTKASDDEVEKMASTDAQLGKRKRELSDDSNESIELEPGLAKSGKKQKIVRLILPSTEQSISTSISKKPQKKAAAVYRESEEPHQSLPTPESTSDSDGSPTSDIEELDVSSELLQLSLRLSAREPLDAKSDSIGQPTVWADSRQALCETVPYFKMPQSGCHQRDGHVYSFLYDGVGHPREYMDTDVIIARAGGSMEQDANGQLQQKKDHSMNEAQVQAFLNDMEHQNPVVVICGNKMVGAMCRMRHRYCVLGWYKPVDLWAEKTLGKGKKAWTTIKYRLERLDSTKSAWYAPLKDVITEEDRKTAGPLVRRECRDCKITSPHVYLNGWMCLNASCERFWKLYCGEDAPYGKLHYNPAFLLDRTQWTNEGEPYDVRPPIPDSGKVIGDNLSKINTRGIVCPKCGRCNQRRLWRGWTCDNSSCDFKAFPNHVPVKPALLHSPWDNVGEGPTLSQNKYARHLGVGVEVSHKLGFKIFTYTFAGIDGKLVHAVSNAKLNRAPGGPDEMFEAMQRQDDPTMNLHLERRPFIGTGSSASLKLKPATKSIEPLVPRPGTESELATTHDLQDAAVADLLNTSQGLFSDETEVNNNGNEYVPKPRKSRLSSKAPGRPSTSAPAPSEPTEDGDFMTSFSMNYGLPYKFVAGGSSLPFSSSPWPVRACRADLNFASQNFLSPTGHSEFNEQLIFAYMEGQKVEYHDDGETGLGPRIASMSFGSKAKMMLRMKGKHYVGCSKTGVFTQDKPVPGSIDGEEMYRKRLAAWEDLEELKKLDKQAYEKRRKELPKELGIFEKKMKKAEDLVTITLNHGDIVLMEGYEIQQYLEHKVVPEGCLRFALTCRTVLPEHLKPEERPSYGVEADEPEMSSLVRLAKSESEAGMGVVVSEVSGLAEQ